MTILLTGFEPFGGLNINPAKQIAERLNDICQVTILPVEFIKATQIIKDLISNYQPDVVISLGLAAGAETIRVERVAINLIDSPIPDNAGAQPIDEPIASDGPAAYFSSLPVKTITKKITSSGVKASLSFSAGSYVCNAVMYTALHTASQLPKKNKTKCGFIHLPLADDINLDDQEHAIRAAVSAATQLEVSYTSGAFA